MQGPEQFDMDGVSTGYANAGEEVEITNNLLPDDPMCCRATGARATASDPSGRQHIGSGRLHRDRLFDAVEGSPGYYIGNYYVTIAGRYDLRVDLTGQGYVSIPSRRPIAVIPTRFSHQVPRHSATAMFTAVFTLLAQNTCFLKRSVPRPVRPPSPRETASSLARPATPLCSTSPPRTPTTTSSRPVRGGLSWPHAANTDYHTMAWS